MSLKIFENLENLIFSHKEVHILEALIQLLHGEVGVERFAKLALRNTQSIEKFSESLIDIILADQIKRLRIKLQIIL